MTNFDLSVLPPTQRRLYKFFFGYAINNGVCYMKTSTIASRCDCSVRTVRYFLRKFAHLFNVKRENNIRYIYPNYKEWAKICENGFKKIKETVNKIKKKVEEDYKEFMEKQGNKIKRNNAASKGGFAANKGLGGNVQEKEPKSCKPLAVNPTNQEYFEQKKREMGLG